MGQCRLGVTEGSLFLDTSRFADLPAQEIELGATHLATANDINLVNAWRVKQEYTLDTDAVALLANGESIASIVALLGGYHHSFKDLNTLFATLDDLYVNAYVIASFEGRHGLFTLRLFNFRYQWMHFLL